MPEELVSLVQKDLAKLGVLDPTIFVPDGDQIAAAVVDLFLITDDYKLPTAEELERWLELSKGISAGTEEIKRFQVLFEHLYLDDAFRQEVLFEIGKRAQAALREADERWEVEVAEVLDHDFQKIDLVKLFGPTEEDTATVEAGTGMADLGAARKFIEQKYPLVTPGVLTTFVFSAGTIIKAGRGSELDELMCERLLVASTPQILGINAVIFGGYVTVMGSVGLRLAQKYLELSKEEMNLIQTTPLKSEHQEILAAMRSA